jgi:agmatine deiminase
MHPKDLHYQMPAEWTPHQRTFISWPVQASMCHPENYPQIARGYREIILAIAEFEPVTVIVNPEDSTRICEFIEDGLENDLEDGLKNGLKNGTADSLPAQAATVWSRIDFLGIRHNDAWLRDNGPTFLRDTNGQLAGVNWRFNAWGGKYAPWDLDDQVAPTLLDYYMIRHFDAPLVMEGGSLHVDGEGTLLTTEECLLNPNRNPDLSRDQIETFLQQYLHVAKIIWLKHGLSGDETDGHIDNIACFVAPGKVLIQVCDDPDDENYAITQENLAILREATDALGRELEIITVQQPPRADYAGSRLTLSYLNFYFVNGGIILPVFGGAAVETDQKAEQLLQELFPERRIRLVNGMGIISEGGNVHCTTQQMPEGHELCAL